jgi:hypothetical protein
MKHLLKITNLAILFLASSCIADLDEYNPSGFTADNVFATEEGHTGLVNLCYSQLRKEFYGRENPVGLTMAGTDIWTDSPAREGYFPTGLYGTKLNSSNEGLMKNCWERLYIPINNCNAAIERGATADYGSEELRTSRIAEARFLRAFYYWHIVEQWGNVVLRIEETKEVVKTAQRSPVRDFYELCIIPDLEFAAANLPSLQADHGRATKASAQGLLARTYLTWASHLKYHDLNDGEALTYYQKAKAAADSVVDNPSKYNVELYGDVREVFAMGNNKNNREAMFVVSHSTSDDLNPQAAANRLPSYFIASYDGKAMGVSLSQLYGYADAVYLAPTKYLLDLYDTSKDPRYDAFFREVWRCNDPNAKSAYWSSNSISLFEKDINTFMSGADIPERLRSKLGFDIGDTAMYFTKKVIPNKATLKYAVRDVNDVYKPDGTLSKRTNDYFFPQLLKYQDTIYATSTTKNNAGKLDVILIRFAEMFLIAAEAQWHISNTDNDPTAIGYINQLRQRGGANTNDVSPAEIAASYNGNGGYLNFILDERARELCGEHLRWFDLKRTRQLEHRLGEGKANPNITAFDPAKHYVRPLPLSFMQSIDNAAEFGQNPNYD